MRIIQSIFLIVVIIGSSGFAGYQYLSSTCRIPLSYSIGRFDERFNISEEEFIEAAKEAEAAWEKAVGRDLFAYKIGGKMPINLIYDERQATADKNAVLEEEISETEETAETVKRRLDALKARYDAASDEYEALLASYKKREAAYNAKVASWNAQGGAGPDDYQKMVREEKDLRAELQSLEARRVAVNALAADVNKLVAEYNAFVKDINVNIDRINESADREFEQGEFKSDGLRKLINIYEYKSRNELVRVLMHEFGHAIGMDHNENEESIMYRLNSSDNLVPTAEDIRDAKIACRMK